MDDKIEFRSVESDEDFENGKMLFREYSDSLEFQLDFQDFEEELKLINKKYSSSEGALFLCLINKEPVGCVAIRRISESIAELKRLYVKPEFRAFKIGGKLMDLALEKAKQIGYEFIRLDTVSEMQAAIGLYKKRGFYEIDAYCHNPITTAVYMEKKL